MLVDFFIPFLSLILGLILLICEKANKNLLVSYKSYLIKLNAKNFLTIFPILLLVTIIARGYCLHLTNSTIIFKITLLIIQLMIVFNFTFLTNITSAVDFDEDNNLI